MICRKISANLVFNREKGFIKNGILVLNDLRQIVDFIDTEGNLKEEANLEFYSGILIPFLAVPLPRKNLQADLNILLRKIFDFQKKNPLIPLSAILAGIFDSAKVSHPEIFKWYELNESALIILIENSDLANIKLTDYSTVRIIAHQI